MPTLSIEGNDNSRFQGSPAEPSPTRRAERSTPVIDEQDRRVDQQVGQRIRQRRKELKLTQESLAESLGISFQQVQKYERGANRVSASKLFAIAGALGVSISYLFDGLEPLSVEDAPIEDVSIVRALLADEAGLGLAKAYLKMRDQALRQRLVELAESLGEL